MGWGRVGVRGRFGWLGAGCEGDMGRNWKEGGMEVGGKGRKGALLCAKTSILESRTGGSWGWTKATSWEESRRKEETSP